VVEPRATADVLDDEGDSAATCELQLRDLGGVSRFAGAIATVRCFEDNLVVRSVLEDAGEGRVLVVDGGGSLRCALVGERVASLALESGWSGLVIHGCVRDSVELATLPVGIKAVGTNPRPSRKTGAGERDVEVRFGGVTFRPGDVLYADEDGIAVVSS